MTWRRLRMNMHDALYQTAQNTPGGVEALASRLGLHKQTLYSKLRREVETHHTSFEESAQIQECAGQYKRPDAYNALHAYAARLGHVAIQLPELDLGIDPAPILQHLCHTFKEEGDVARQIEQSLADDQRISSQELDDIEAEVFEAVTALMLLLELCRKKHEQDISHGR